MGIGQLFPPQSVQVTATTSGGYAYEPLTDWIPATGIAYANMVLRVAGSTTLITQPAVQTATVRTDKPNAWATLGSTLTGDGEAAMGSTSVQSTTAGVNWVRFGIAYQATTGSFGTGTAWLQVAADAWGQPIATKTFQAGSEVDSSNQNVEPVTPWIPAMFADKVKMTIVTSQMTTFGVQPVFQTATTLTKTASAWSSTGMGSAITTNQESCTGELPTSGDFASVMWVRFGVAFYKTSGSLGQGNISVSVSVRTV